MHIPSRASHAQKAWSRARRSYRGPSWLPGGTGAKTGDASLQSWHVSGTDHGCNGRRIWGAHSMEVGRPGMRLGRWRR